MTHTVRYGMGRLVQLGLLEANKGNTMKHTTHASAAVRLVTETTPYPNYLAEGDAYPVQSSWLFAEVDSLLNDPAVKTKRYPVDTFHVAAWCGTRKITYLRPIKNGAQVVRSTVVGNLVVGTHRVSVVEHPASISVTDDVWTICLEATVTGVRTSATRVTAAEL